MCPFKAQNPPNPSDTICNLFIHQQGDIKNIENYRPIANLCSTSKIFEKLILQRILEIKDENQCDLTGQNQHGFKKNRSTATLFT